MVRPPICLGKSLASQGQRRAEPSCPLRERCESGITARLTKPESCHGIVGVATRILLLISREPMQKPLARGLLGDEGVVLIATDPRWPG